jgi:hypothetical protein
MSLCSAVLLAACGGSGGGAGAPTGGGAGAPPSTTLSISSTALVLSVDNTVASPTLTGNPRIFTVTNVGTATALAVIHARSTASPAWPTGTNSSSNCTTLAPGASCTITITPGNTASAAPGDLAPVPITLSVGGSNTNLLAPTVQVLTHGSVYQGGYVFSIDDTTPNTGNIGGKVTALTDAVPVAPGVIWSSLGNNGTSADAAYNAVLGTNDTSTTALGDACNGGTDGACNTTEITTLYTGVNNAYYAAGACRATQAGYSDWHLPAICELGGQAAANCAPGGASMQANLIDNGAINVAALPTAVNYWSSTSSNINATFFAWSHQFATGGAATSFEFNKNNMFPVRCVRALTP